jgi:hypothetical protein
MQVSYNPDNTRLIGPDGKPSNSLVRLFYPHPEWAGGIESALIHESFYLEVVCRGFLHVCTLPVPIELPLELIEYYTIKILMRPHEDVVFMEKDVVLLAEGTYKSLNWCAFLTA